MAGCEKGAKGCIVPVDLTRDGIAVLCANGGFSSSDGVFHAAADSDFIELRRLFPKLVTVGQAIELAKSCALQLGVLLKNPHACPQIKIALSHAEYLDSAHFIGLDMDTAAAAARKNPALHIMGDITGTPDDPAALVRTAQQNGLFGLRGTAEQLTPALCEEALRCGLFLAAEAPMEQDVQDRMLAQGVNFIESEQPGAAQPKASAEQPKP